MRSDIEGTCVSIEICVGHMLTKVLLTPLSQPPALTNANLLLASCVFYTCQHIRMFVGTCMYMYILFKIVLF